MTGVILYYKERRPWIIIVFFIGTVAPWLYKLIIINKEYDIAFFHVLISSISLLLLLNKVKKKK